MRLIKGLSILYFQRTSSCIHWSFALFLRLYYVSFFPDLYYFLPYTHFELCLFFFFQFLNCRLFIGAYWWGFFMLFCFVWDRPVILWIFLWIAFPVSHRYWIALVCLSVAAGCLFIASLISLLTYWVFNNMLFTFHVFVCFSGYFLWLISSSIALG